MPAHVLAQLAAPLTTSLPSIRQRVTRAASPVILTAPYMAPTLPAVQSVTRQSAIVPPLAPISTPEATRLKVSFIRPWATVTSFRIAPASLMLTTVLNSSAA